MTGRVNVPDAVAAMCARPSSTSLESVDRVGTGAVVAIRQYHTRQLTMFAIRSFMQDSGCE